MNNGWIKIHRSMLDWEWWDDQNTARVWLTILLSVNHEPKRWHGMIIDTGEMVTSRAKLAKKSGLSERAVRTSLERLKSTNEVTCKTTKHFTIIKVVKWDVFQAYDGQSDQPNDQQPVQHVTNERPTNDHKQEYKNDKNIRNKNIFRKPTLDEVRSYIEKNNLNVDADYFYDYYESNGWKVGGKASMKSWESTLKNWHRRDTKKQEDMPF